MAHAQARVRRVLERKRRKLGTKKKLRYLFFSIRNVVVTIKNIFRCVFSGRIDEEEEATSGLQSSASDSEENDDSDADTQTAVMERLQYYMEQFRLKTDTLIGEQESDFRHHITPSPKTPSQSKMNQDVSSSSNSEFHMKGARGRRGKFRNKVCNFRKQLRTIHVLWLFLYNKPFKK